MDEVPAALRRGGGAVLLAVVLGGLVVVSLEGASALPVRLVLVVGAAVTVVAGVRRHRPSHPRPWWLLIAGLSASIVGDVAVLVAASRGQLDGNLPLDAWLTAAAGVLFLAAILDVVRAVAGTGRLGALDAVVATTAGGTVLWQLLVVPAATPGWSGSGTELAGSLQVAAMLGVLALLGQLLLVLPRGRRVAATWLVFGIVAALTAFLVGALRDATGADAYGGLRAVAGAVANLAAAVAAWHPSMRWLTVRHPVAVDGPGPGRTALLAVALASPPLVLLLAVVTERPLSLISLALTWTVLSIALAARGALLERGREAAREQLDRTERRLISLVGATGDTVLLVALADDGAPRIRFASPSAARQLGCPPEELRHRPVASLVEEEDRATLHRLVVEDGPLPRTTDVRALHRDGHHRWVEAVVSEAPQEEVASVVLTLRDVDERKRAELELAEVASRDPLTGLWNRRAFEAALGQLLTPVSATATADPATADPATADPATADPATADPATAGGEPDRTRRRGADVALLLVDLDRFKEVNDRAGHAAGDAVLARVAAAIASAVREQDVVARVGGDEFGVLCTRVAPHDDIEAVAERIAALLIPSEAIGAPVGASVGVAVARDGDTVASLLARADGALYRAKAAGRGRVEIADDEGPAVQDPARTG